MVRLVTKLSSAAVFALATLPALSSAQAAWAAPAQAATLARIPVGDLDLSRPHDARLFLARVDAAGEAVCQARVRAERLDRFSAKACRLDIQDEALSKLSRRQTRALHAGVR